MVNMLGLDFQKIHVMGILNVTPDSFSDGGQFFNANDALTQAESMLQAGASIIDVGGESTRPGAEPVSSEQEIKRVLPVVQAIKQEFNCLISVDTSNPALMQMAADAGADLINDVRAVSRPGAIEAAAQTELPVCLMHMQGKPSTMQLAPNYQNVLQDVKSFLQSRVEQCMLAGIQKSKLMVDPGFGFGKSLQHNLLLLKELKQLQDLHVPILIGVSRKSMFAELLGQSIEERLISSISAALYAAGRGANILRVHDVAATMER